MSFHINKSQQELLEQIEESGFKIRVDKPQHSLDNKLKLFYWKFVESINTMYSHTYFALARDKNHAIDLIRLQLDFSDRQKEKESNFILKSIASNEPEIIETEKGVLILSKC